MRSINVTTAHGKQRPDVLCFSHLRWEFVYQRPQHLMTRFAAKGRVFYFEEPVWTESESKVSCDRKSDQLCVITPYLPRTSGPSQISRMQTVVDGILIEHGIHNYCSWYYTPMALPWTRRLQPRAVIYDCMDELSAFKNAPEELKHQEAELLKVSDLVFTGGHSLYEAKRRQHSNVYPFPSGIDVDHFLRARKVSSEPEDQAGIPHPRLGFFGVVDERMDLDLLGTIALARPDWHFVIIGPVVKIDAGALPQASNIHYLGMKSYKELPEYLGGWDVAIMPFAKNEATKFISPTKTPEYLAGGVPVVSTSIRDVVHPYGDLGLVHIADTPEKFIAAVEKARHENPHARLRIVDHLLSQMSWSRTWGRMVELIDDVIERPAHMAVTTAKAAAAAAVD